MYWDKSTKFRGKSTEVTGTKIRNFLRHAHPTKTADRVAADTGISARTVATWLEGSTVPGGLALLTVINAYGPEFLAAVLPEAPAWLRKAHREARQAQLEAEVESLRVELERLR